MKNILAAVDFSPASKAVVRVAADMARAFKAKLWLVHAAETLDRAALPGVFLGDPATSAWAEFTYFNLNLIKYERQNLANKLKREHAELLAMAHRLQPGIGEVRPLLIEGPVLDVLLRAAGKIEADMIVMGSHGHGPLRKALLGSVSEGLLRRSGRPVLIVPPEAASALACEPPEAPPCGGAPTVA